MERILSSTVAVMWGVGMMKRLLSEFTRISGIVKRAGRKMGQERKGDEDIKERKLQLVYILQYRARF